ncbi:MAG: hypothetical protein RIF33_23070 [Cyclobacteriaceae bacterium]
MISGIVLFGLLQVPDLLDEMLLFVKREITNRYTDMDNFVSIMKVSVFWLVLGLIIHLITRGIWIGLVGLSFVLPDGMNRSRLKFVKEFDQEIDRIPSINGLIIRWEKICSSIFSISFLLFMSVVGAYVFVFCLLGIPYFLFDFFDVYEAIDPYFDAYSIIVRIVAVIVMIDYLTFGLVKKIPVFSRVYHPFSQVVRVISLSFLYRPIYYAWASHANRWIFMVVMILFIVANYVLADRFYRTDRIDVENSNVSLFFSTMGNGAYSGYYEDMDVEFYSFRAQIPSDIIEGNVLRVFVALSPDHEDDIVSKCGFDETIDRQEIGAAKALACFNEAYQLSLGDSLLTDVAYKFHYRQSNQQKGLLTWIDISTLPEGMSELKVKLILEKDTIRYAEIPFYKTQKP